MATIAVSGATFKDEVIQSEIPVLVDFWADWCMPCKMMGIVLEELSEDPEVKGKITIAKLDTEQQENQELVQIFQIQSIPNMKLFHKGKAIKEFIGLRMKDDFKKELKEALAGIV
jgi:thioredoxin 1